MSQILLDNTNFNTTSEVFNSLGGVAVINILADDFGAGSVAIQMTTNNSKVIADPWVTLDNGVFTENSIVKLDYLPTGTLIRAVLSGVDGSTLNVFVDILV